MTVDAQPVRRYLEDLQDRICSAFEELDGTRFDARVLEGQRGGQTRPRVLSDGELFERAAVIGTSSQGDRLPPAATERRPELTGRGFQATSLSLIVHPRNPYVPTVHANLRFFMASQPQGVGEEAVDRKDPVWWFGGGFDLTPYYGFEEDARHWHRVARRACEPFGPDVYPRLKRQCDEYFYLPHREEPRGIGGLFFDDLDAAAAGELFEGENVDADGAATFERCFAFVRSVGDHFLDAYLPIVERRRDHPWGEREREFQLYRRGRYVEFNLAYDRGTRYGLQVGGRAESILASLPPLVTWRYDWSPPPGSDEERLYTDFLVARDWAEGE